jgi:hypothetical protein
MKNRTIISGTNSFVHTSAQQLETKSTSFIQLLIRSISGLSQVPSHSTFLRHLHLSLLLFVACSACISGVLRQQLV